VYLDIFVRSLIVLIFVSGSVVISFFSTRVIAYLIPYPLISGVFLWTGTLVFSALMLMGVAYFYVYHGFGAQADIIRKKPAIGKKVVLTFDDGPSRNYTPQILKILAEKKVRATFFMVGAQVEKYPEIAQQIVDEGHEVGNHTYGHITVPHAPPTQLASQIMRTNLSILQHSGRYPLYLRPPRGLYDMRMRRIAMLMGQEVVLWSLSSQDWYPRATGAAVARRVIERASSGDIILFHDSGSLLGQEGSNRRPTVEALSPIIDGLRDKGFEIISLEEFISLAGQKTA
jgi:peptidoglycan-N-acetylglucosamine deacetylase